MPNETEIYSDLLTASLFAHTEPMAQFYSAVNACWQTLRLRFPEYAEFVQQRMGRLPDVLITAEAMEALPSVYLPVLKARTFQMPSDVDISVRLTSSGTSGRPSTVPLDDENMQRRIAAMRGVYMSLGILSGPCTAIGFLMDPTTTQMAGSLVIDAVLRSHDDVKAIYYLARMGQAGPEFDVAAAQAILQQALASGPILAVGYPALIAAGIQRLRDSGLSQLPLPVGSRILTGGGWKSFLPGVRLDQAEFRNMAAEFFQLEPTAIRDMFGLSECPAVFVQCEQGSYHVPVFAWAQAIDPESQRSVNDGEVGLLQLTVPLTTSYPLLKILTTDKVILAHDCACGRAAPMIVPQGRVSAARFETCAMKIGQAVA